MLSQGFYPQIVLLDQSATREATHPPELTAVNSTHKFAVQEYVGRRLRDADARILQGVLTENPARNRCCELTQDQTAQQQAHGIFKVQLDRNSEFHRYLGVGPKRQIKRTA